jgi:hypothetical protein
VREGRALPWFGNHPKFHEVAFSLPLGEISEPFETAVGLHMIRVEEVREPRQRPFEEVRRDVEGRIARERSTKALPELLAELKERYRVKIYEAGGRSAEELFTEAQSATDPRRRLELYQQLVDGFPDHERVLESWFMIGFIRSEELGDREGANAAFKKVIAIDGDSELAQSARWMLSSGQDEFPPFEDEPLPEGSEEEM